MKHSKNINDDSVSYNTIDTEKFKNVEIDRNDKCIKIDIMEPMPKTRENRNANITKRILGVLDTKKTMVVRRNLSTGAVCMRLINAGIDKMEAVKAITECEKTHQYNGDGFCLVRSIADDSWTIIADGNKHSKMVEPVEGFEFVQSIRDTIEANRKITEDIVLSDSEIDQIMIAKNMYRAKKADALQSALYKLTVFFLMRIKK